MTKQGTDGAIRRNGVGRAERGLGVWGRATALDLLGHPVMNRLRLVLLVFSGVWAGGCSTTTFDSAQSPSTGRWLRDRASNETWVLERRDPPPVGPSSTPLLESTSPTQVRFKLRDDRLLSLERTQRVVVVKRTRGAAEGALLGAAIGIATGVTLGLTQPLSRYEASMDCTIVCSKADAARWQGAMFGSVGLLVGALVGVVVGHRDVLQLQ